MSGGRSFALTDDSVLSPEDRLALLEQKIPALIDRIQSYDRMLDQFQALEAHLQSQQDVNSTAKNCLDDLYKKYLKLSSQADAQAQMVQNTVVDHANKIAATCDSLNDTSALLLDLEGSHFSLYTMCNEMIENSKKIFSTHDMFNELRSFVETKFKPVDGIFAVINGFDKKIQDQGTLSIQQSNDLSAKIKDLQDFCLNISSSIQKQAEDLKKIPDSFAQSIASGLDTHNRIFDYKLNELKISLQDTPQATASVKADLMSKLEGVALDGSNAVLRATNAASKVAILEKKIENLYLLVNKLQIQA